jgi:hypothetical protein
MAELAEKSQPYFKRRHNLVFYPVKPKLFDKSIPQQIFYGVHVPKTELPKTEPGSAEMSF